MSVDTDSVFGKWCQATSKSAMAKPTDAAKRATRRHPVNQRIGPPEAAGGCRVSVEENVVIAEREVFSPSKRGHVIASTHTWSVR